MEFPKFSVILPTYNRAFIIQSAIDSVLKQFYENFELIIVDDGSTDQTEQLIQKNYKQQLKTGKINYIKCAHLGVCAARNVGLDAAKNDWIAYIDSDNIMFKEALGTFASFIQNNKDTKNFYGSMISMSSKKIYGNFFSYSQLKENNFIDLGTYVHHKSLIKECGKFNLNIKKYVDWDFILRQCYLYTPIFIKTAVLYYNDSLRFKRITTEEKKAENFKQVKLNIEKFEKDIAENKRINDEQQNDTSQQDVSVLSIKSDFPKTANPIRFSFSSDKDTQKKTQNNLTLAYKEVQPQQKIYSQLSKFAYFKIIISNCNSMPYIQKCLDSILTQTFQDFKIIIVDDMSTDGSDKFCEMYSQKYPDKIIYQKLSLKGYTGKARNYGIRYNLNCSYYYFINSDEYLENNTALEKLYNSTCKDSPHMVLFKMTLKSPTGQVIHSEALPSYDKFIKQKNSNILLSFWNSSSSRIVRSDKIQFFLERSIYAEDTYQWMLLVDNCTRIKEIDEDIYVHQQNITDSSIDKDTKLEEKSQKIFIDELVKYYHKTANKKLQLDIIGYLQSIKNVLYPYVVNTLQTLEIEKHEKEYKLSKKEKTISQEKPYTKLSHLDKADVSQKAVDQQTESVFFKIIIPNYNNMPYIQKCLDSILTQTFQDFKIIIVDDMSTDGSDKFCEMYQRKYSDKIIFIQAEKKLYAGGCRNLGIDYKLDAKYYYFIDGDDYLANDSALETLYKAVIETLPELVLFKLIVKTLTGNTIRYSTSVKYKNFIKQKTSNILLSFWNSASSRIVRADKIKYFLENSIYAEDTYQWMQLYDSCTNVKEIFDDIYIYQQHIDSSTHTTDYNLRLNSQKIFINSLLNYYVKTENKKIKNSILARLDMVDLALKPYVNQQLKKLALNKKIKIAVYTYCTNNTTGKQYQTVKYPADNIDYYMFVDNKQKNENKRNGWTVLQVEQKPGYAVEDLNKYYKWHPVVIPNYKQYDYIIYVDSKVEILDNPNIIIESIKNNIPLGVCCHKYNYRAPIIPDNYKCLYKHIDYLIAFPAGCTEKLKEWKNYLLSINFPENQQFAETAVIITDMHNPNGLKLESEIFDLYLHAATLRDQVVIPLILAKKSYSIDQLCTLGKYTTYQDELGSKYFKNNRLTNINRRN